MSDASPPRRVALVIGIGAYETARKLLAPPGDAARMGALLHSMGFAVQPAFNSDFNALRQALRDFYDALRGADVGLLYFSGHGVQDDARENYLLPTDADLHEPEDLTRLAFSLRRIMSDMHDRVETGLIFVDACRDNPFDDDAAPATKSVLAGAGLAKPKGSLSGLLVAFASDEGNVALDGSEAAASPFTAALLRHLPVPGRPVTSALIDVCREVAQETKGRQTPWTQASLQREVVLVPGAQTTPTAPPPEPQPQPQPQPQPRPAPIGVVSRRLNPILFVPVILVMLGLAGFGYLRLQPSADTSIALSPIDPLASSAATCSTLAGVDETLCRIKDMDAPDKTTRLAAAAHIEQALASASVTDADKSMITGVLLTLAQPENLRLASPDGRFNLLARLAAIPTDLWLRPAMLPLLEQAHQTIALLVEMPDLYAGAQTTAQMDQWIGNTGSEARSKIRIVPQYHGFSRDQFQTLMQGLLEGWGWKADAIDQENSAAGLAEVRYGPDTMRPLALLLAAQLSGQIEPHSGDAGRDAAIRRAIAQLGKTVKVRKIRMADAQLEIWLGK